MFVTSNGFTQFKNALGLKLLVSCVRVNNYFMLFSKKCIRVEVTCVLCVRVNNYFTLFCMWLELCVHMTFNLL
jgi:hypothetical protein